MMPASRPRSQRSQRRFRWPLTWVGKLISAAAAAAVSGAVGVIVNNLTQSPVSGGGHAQAVRPGPPVLIDSFQSLHEANDYAFPAGVKITDRQISDLNSQASTGDYGDWLTNHGGVGVGMTVVQLVVSGNANGGVRITNITLIKNCQEPLRGTLFSAPPQGEQASIPMRFNLDKSTSNSQTLSGQDYFSMKTIELKFNEQQVIDIAATTNRFYCSYQLGLTVLADGKSVTEHVPADGKRFKVTAYSTRYSSIYQRGNESADPNKFVPVNPETWKKPKAGYHG